MSSPPFNVCIIESGNVSLFYEPQTAGSHYLLKKKKKVSNFERPGHFTSESGFKQKWQHK